MNTAPIPKDESLRLNDLLSHHILDTGEEESYTELLEIAAQICDCPTALISLVDKDRQWFKAKINSQDNELPRNTSFCGHAIAQNEIFIVEDASKDKRFYDNPYVTGGLNIGFYAGAQIVSKSGFNLGTVCVIDSHPKSITEGQKDTLKKIASQVSKMMEIRKQETHIRKIAGSMHEKELKSEKNFETFFTQSNSPKIIFNGGGCNILDANEQALKLYGYNRDEFLQMTAMDIRVSRSKEDMMARIEKVESSVNPVTLKGKHKRKDGKVLSVSLKYSAIFYKGHPARLADITDITYKKDLLVKLKDEKELSEKKLVQAAVKAKDKERKRNTDILRENINQVLACTNLYLDIAKKNEGMRLELIEKSQGHILLAIQEIKKLYKLAEEPPENYYLENAIEELVLKYELLRSFCVSFTTKGDEKYIPVKTRWFVFKIIEEYFDAAFKTSGIKNVWLTITFGSNIELAIKNDNSQPNINKRKLYMQRLKAEIVEFNGTVELIEDSNISCVLILSIPIPVPASAEYRKFAKQAQPAFSVDCSPYNN